MPEIIDLLRSAANIDARLSQSRQVTLVAGETNVVKPVEADINTVSVYKLTDGARGERASKAGLTQSDAEKYISDHPGIEYEIVPE